VSVEIEKLIAYADGELGPEERAEVERALAADPALREKLAAHTRVRAQLAQAFDGTLREPVPRRLSDILNPLTQGASEPAAATATVVDLAQRRDVKAAIWSGREWGAMAASLAAGLVIAFGVAGANAPMMAVTDHGVSARGALARALDTQLAADADARVRIGLTFRDQSGLYCRTFDLTQSDTSGLACREEGGWRIDMTAAHAGGGEVRMAGSAEEILAAVDARIAGEPLDADAEARARDADWR